MLTFLIASLALGNVVQASSPSWTVYHSWNADQEFSRRGELKWSEEEGALQITNDEDGLLLTQENVQSMLEYGWYHVKIQNPNDDDYVLSTVPACNVRRANFKDEFQVTLPRTQESQITSLAYLPLVSPLAPQSCDGMAQVNDATFTSKVSHTLDTPGAILKAVLPATKPPPGMTFISHPNLKKNAAGGGASGKKGADGGIPDPDQEPPQSFLRRYWYIILPLMIVYLMGGATEQPQEPGQGGGGQGSRPAAGGRGSAAPASASASADAGGARKRRGKRT